jgi:thiamine biosynthesis lipoprotein
MVHGPFAHTETCMGTVFSFTGISPLSTSDTVAAVAAACKLLHQADATFSLYKPESPLSALARGETSVAKCPPEVDQIWDACEAWEKTTDGWFSAFTPQHTFDPSGIVKTWAAKAAADSILAAGITDFTMNAGGDVFISDGATPRNDWRIAIHKPVSVASAEAGVLTVVDLLDTPYRAMATSGSAERGQHIWNPKAPEKAAANELVQVSVVARDLVEADIWATAAFAAGSRGIALLDNFNEAHPDQDVQAFFIWPDGQFGATKNFVPLFAKSQSQTQPQSPASEPGA